MTTKKMLVFDVDGTLFDTKPGIILALEDVFTKFSIGEFDRTDSDKYIGPPIKESIQKYCGVSNDLASEATEYYRRVYIEKHIVHSTLYEGIFQLLVELRNSGFGLSIATMKTCQQVDKLFAVTFIDKDMFDHIETAAENGKYKKADMLKKISKQSGCSEVIMIGDTENDRKAAYDANVGFVGVTYGYGFQRGKAYEFCVANSIGDLQVVLENR